MVALFWRVSYSLSYLVIVKRFFVIKAVKSGFVKNPTTSVVNPKTEVIRPPNKLIVSIMTPSILEPFSVTVVILSVFSNSILNVTSGSISLDRGTNSVF